MNAQSRISADTHQIASAHIPLAEFRRAARLMAQVVPRWNVIPVLGYVRVTIGHGRVSLCATDLDIELTVNIDADVAFEGEAAVMIRAATLASFAAAARSVVKISVHAPAIEDTPSMILMDGGDMVVRQRALIPAGDFPQFSASTVKTATWTQTSDELRRMIHLCRHCISAEETRYYLNGIYLHARPDGSTLRAVATDGHRLAVADTDTQIGAIPGQTLSAIIPKQLVDLLKQVTRPGDNAPLRVTMWERHVHIHGLDIEVSAKLIDGRYPEYSRVIPAASDAICCTISGAELTRLQRAAAGADYDAHIARLDASKGMICIGNQDGGIEMPIGIKCKDGMAPPVFGFNLRYLAEQGRVTPTFTVKGASCRDPFIIHGDDPDAMFVLMPARV